MEELLPNISNYFKSRKATRFRIYKFVNCQWNSFPLLMHSYSRLVPTIQAFSSNKESLIDIINVTDCFSFFSGVKSIHLWCEIACIWALKGVSLALCGMDWINLTSKTTKTWTFIFLIIKHLKMRRPWKAYSKNRQNAGDMENEKFDYRRK